MTSVEAQAVVSEVNRPTKLCYHPQAFVYPKRVQIKFMGVYLNVEIVMSDDCSMCKFDGIVRSTPVSPHIPFKYGDKVSVYGVKRSDRPSDHMIFDHIKSYYIVMDKSDIRERVYEPMYQQQLAYVKKLHAMKTKDAYFILERDKTVDKEALLYFAEGKDDMFAMRQADIGGIDKKCGVSVVKDLWLLGFKYDVLVHFDKEIGYDKGQTHIYDAVIWKTNYPSHTTEEGFLNWEAEPNPIEHLVDVGTKVSLSDDHDGSLHIIIEDTKVDEIVKYRTTQLKEKLQALDSKMYYYQVYEALTDMVYDEEDDDEDPVWFERLYLLKDEDAIVSSIDANMHSNDNTHRLSYWKMHMTHLHSQVSKPVDDSDSED